MNIADNDFALTEGEKGHPLWRRLEARLGVMLTNARGKNDDPTLSPDQTAALRGRIGCLRELIRLGAEPPPLDG